MDHTEHLSQRVLDSLRSLNESLGFVRDSVATIDSVATTHLSNSSFISNGNARESIHNLHDINGKTSGQKLDSMKKQANIALQREYSGADRVIRVLRRLVESLTCTVEDDLCIEIEHILGPGSCKHLQNSHDNKAPETSSQHQEISPHEEGAKPTSANQSQQLDGTESVASTSSAQALESAQHNESGVGQAPNSEETSLNQNLSALDSTAVRGDDARFPEGWKGAEPVYDFQQVAFDDRSDASDDMSFTEEVVDPEDFDRLQQERDELRAARAQMAALLAEHKAQNRDEPAEDAIDMSGVEVDVQEDAEGYSSSVPHKPRHQSFVVPVEQRVGGAAEWEGRYGVETRNGVTTNVEYEAFNLKIVYEVGRTGFEDSKDFIAPVDSVIAGKYLVLEHLGSSAFSSAIAARDVHTGQEVCLKVVKNNKDYFDQSLDEIKLLRHINGISKAGLQQLLGRALSGHSDDTSTHIDANSELFDGLRLSDIVLQLYDYFYFKEHLILVTELLKDNLFEFGKFLNEVNARHVEEAGADEDEQANSSTHGITGPLHIEPYFTMPRLQHIVRQLLLGLCFCHESGIIHCDLKPENILVRSYSRASVSLIDFGSSCYITDALSSYVQSRSYRAPEVILGMPYDTKIDIWSLGCILYELVTNKVMFLNDSVPTLLVRMQCFLGTFPPKWLEVGRSTDAYFTGKQQVFEIDQNSQQIILLHPKKIPLRERLLAVGADELFADFVSALLTYDPKDRPSAAQALKHKWMLQQYDLEPYELPQ